MNTFFTANTVRKVDELSGSGFHYLKSPQGGSTMTEQDYKSLRAFGYQPGDRGPLRGLKMA